MHRVYEMVKREAERHGAMPWEAKSSDWCRKKRLRWRRTIFCSWRTFRRTSVRNKLAAALTGAPVQGEEAKFGKLARPFSKPSPTNRDTWRGSVSAFASALALRSTNGGRAFPQKKSQRGTSTNFPSIWMRFVKRATRSPSDDRDAASYDAVMAAFNCPGRCRRNATARGRIQTATRGAAEVPLGVASGPLLSSNA